MSSLPKPGDTVRLKPEFLDPADQLTYVAVSEVEKGRLDVRPIDSGLPFPPVSTIRLDMLEGF